MKTAVKVNVLVDHITEEEYDNICKLLEQKLLEIKGVEIVNVGIGEEIKE